MWDHAGRECDQVQHIPSVERSILHGPAFDHFADRSGLSLQEGRLIGDRHRLGDVADLECGVDAYRGFHLDADGLPAVAFESGVLHLDTIVSREADSRS